MDIQQFGWESQKYLSLKQFFNFSVNSLFYLLNNFSQCKGKLNQFWSSCYSPRLTFLCCWPGSCYTICEHCVPPRIWVIFVCNIIAVLPLIQLSWKFQPMTNWHLKTYLDFFYFGLGLDNILCWLSDIENISNLYVVLHSWHSRSCNIWAKNTIFNSTQFLFFIVTFTLIAQD